MANCMGISCSHMDEKSGKCTFSGNCIVRQYNLNNVQSVEAVLDVKPEKVVEVKEAQADEVVFNPFQRGNGCMLAGYTHDEIWSHVR